MKKTGGLKIRTLDTAAAIESLVPDWRALERATPEANGFQSPAWRKASPPDVAPRLVSVREDGRLVLLLCLGVRTLWGGARAACWLGEPLLQYGDALALPGPDRPRWLEAALKEVHGWRDVDLIALGRLRDDGVLAACDLAVRPQIGGDARAPFVDLTAPLQRGGRSVERRIRKLGDCGALRLERVADAAGRREAALQALDFKQAWLRERRRISSALSTPGAVDGLLALAECGALDAWRLWAGDRLASVELGLRAGKSYRSLIGAYDPALAGSAPGHALTLRLLERLAGDGFEKFDFLPPGDGYKFAFANDEVRIGSHYHALNARGALAAFALRRLRPMAKKLVYGALDGYGALRRFDTRAPQRAERAKPSPIQGNLG